MQPFTIANNGANTNTPDVIFDGLYKINLDPSSNKPLVESRSPFTDLTQYFGSKDYFNQLGLNGAQFLSDLDRQMRTDNLVPPDFTHSRMLGDSFVEFELITKQLATLTKDSLLLDKSLTDSNAQIMALIENSVAEFARLGLNAIDVAIKGLDKSQRDGLATNILTFENVNINGMNVLAPKIYLARSTRDRLFDEDAVTGAVGLATNATIFAKNNVTIDGRNTTMTNNGSIVAGNNVAIDVASFTNKTNSTTTASVVAGNNLDIVARVGNIKNIGANIAAVNAVNITATNGSVINSAIVSTNDINLLNSQFGEGAGVMAVTARIGKTTAIAAETSSVNVYDGDSYVSNGLGAASSGYISSALVADSSIRGGSVNIAAANDFTNLAASVSATQNTLADTTTTSGNVAITTGNNINIQTLQLHNRTERSWGNKKKGGTEITDTVTNIGSDIESEGSITFTSLGKDANIIGSNVSASNNINITAKDNVNITSATDSYYHFSAGKTGRGKSYLDERVSTAQVSSNLTTTNNGDIVIASGVGNTQTIGAVDENGNSTSKGSINIIASNLHTKDIDNNEANNIGNGDIKLTAKEDINILSALNTNYVHTISGKKTSWVKKSHDELDYTETNVSSNIIASGNVSNGANSGDVKLASGDGTNIVAANIAGNNGEIIVGKYVDTTNANAITITDAANLTIRSGQNYHLNQTADTKIKRDAGAVAVGAAAAAIAVAAAGVTAGTSLALAAGSGAMIGSQSQRGRTTTSINEDIIQISSNLNFKNNFNIQSSADTTITASNLSSDNATILTGKFRDKNTHIETVVNTDAKLNINSALDTHTSVTTVHQVKPNYLGVALVAGSSAYIGAKASQSQNIVSDLGPNKPLFIINGIVIPGFVVGSAASSLISKPAQYVDPIFNFRTKNTYHEKSSTEIETDFNFNQLITE